MSANTLSAEEQKIFDHIVELEKAGGSDAYVDAVKSAPTLLHHANNNDTPMGLDSSVPLTTLKVTSQWGEVKGSATTQDGHTLACNGVGYISTDVSISSGTDATLYYLTWGLLLGANSCSLAGSEGYLYIYFSTNSIPSGFIKAKVDFGAVAGKGSCSWK